MVFTKIYGAPPYDEREILRYAGCKGDGSELRGLLAECEAEAAGTISYKVCYTPLTVRIEGELCDLGAFGARSKDLARDLTGCDTAVVFAATVGVGIDRLIARYGALSPAKALILDAIGTERIEALCDIFCLDIERELNKTARPRFSPGYGDLEMSVQREIFAGLDCRKRIGLTVTDSLMMSPSKSVTAVVGLYDKKPGK